jgi:hypothetical protein
MGYSKNSRGITQFRPDDTDNTLYIPSSQILSLSDLLEAINNKWPNTDPSDILIDSEHIQIDCIGYDQ